MPLLIQTVPYVEGHYDPYHMDYLLWWFNLVIGVSVNQTILSEAVH